MKITENVTWIGKIDWELRKFHGEQLSTYKGSSYNSYLIRDEKIAIIDTVWKPFAEEFISNLKQQVELDKIDYIIVTHAEPDHSGALPLLVEQAKNAKIICSANGAKSIKGYYHKDWNFQTVKSGDKLSLGKNEITFIEAPMLHWPDTMMCFLSGDNILFSSDVFGQHYASYELFDDKVEDKELLYYEALKYFANIIAPFSKKTIKKIEELISLNLPIDTIATAHGIIWRKDIKTIIDKYLEWSNGYKENQITIVYDTMYDSTRKMAESIAEGIKSVDKDCVVKLFNSARSDNSDIITEVIRSKAILIGSPTYNNGILNSTAAILEEIKGLSLEGKKAASFGSYGWSPANVKIINEFLQNSGFELFEESVKTQWSPNQEEMTKLMEFGKKFAEFAGK
ncbi:MAG TPA: MBL fold metallo-hydrolase [Candidatus Kapabacteria bacterium]|nr:MBL fold metallo-hydrolase [Candidatus Kapabacteria bacterium]